MRIYYLVYGTNQTLFSSSNIAEDLSSAKGDGYNCNWSEMPFLVFVRTKIVSKGNIYCQSKMMDKRSFFIMPVALTPECNVELNCMQRNCLPTRRAGLGALTNAVFAVLTTSFPSNTPKSHLPALLGGLRGSEKLQLQ